jgi:hypothetical protein
VLEQHDVGGMRPTGSQSYPCLCNVRARVVPPVRDFSVVVPDRMFLAEQVVLDLLDVGASEM